MKIETQATLAERNKELVLRAVEEVWNGGNYSNLEDFLAPDFVVHTGVPGEEIHGPDAARQFYSLLRKAFPDLHFTIETQVAEADTVVTHCTMRGTHKGEFKGIPPTGKQISVKSVDIDRLVNGKVVECWGHMDELSLLQQIGAITETGNTING
jgi:steroid delta-isomerase-like uncharacterized protein